MSEGGGTPSDRMRERADRSRPTLWILLSADRRVVTGLLLGGTFLALAGGASLSPTAAGAIRSGDSVDTLFQALLTATITGVTLVVTLNQVVLSQELGAVGDQRERMEGALSFRDDVADLLGTPVAPARPAQFLRALVEVAGDRARDLREAVGVDGGTGGGDGPGGVGGNAGSSPMEEDGDRQGAVADLTGSVITNADRVSTGLDGARFGEFDVVASALDFNYSWKTFEARRIRARYADDLPPEARTALDGLVEALELFGPAREHVKTLYFQWELVDLSRRIVAAAVPALLVSAWMVAFFDAASYGGAGGPGPVLPLVALVALAATVALAPFFVLLSHVLRIATVAKRTLSIGPFILRETGGGREVDWDR